MKKIFALLLLASTSCFFSVNAIAEDVCYQMPGHWSGMFLLKDEGLCKENNGCAHYVSADVKALHAMYYELHFKTPLSKDDKGIFMCEDGIIRAPLQTENNAFLKCNSAGSCTVSFEDDNILMQVRKRS